MDEQIILGSDENGQFTGQYMPKVAGHSGQGIRHLAISVFIYNSKSEILLQKRKHEVFDNIWDNTAATHQLHDPKSGADETDEQATLRALKREYNIENVELHNLGAFNYFAVYNNLCENEHCKLLIGLYDGEVQLNPEVGYEYKWLNKKKFLKDIEKDPNKYTPWCLAALPILKEKGFFD